MHILGLIRHANDGLAMTKKYRQVAELIAGDCKSWVDQFALVAPAEIARRKKYNRSTKSFVQTIIGLLMPPQLGDGETAYIFEGLRNKEYMNAFKPETVIVVGSRIEKTFAKSKGYRFCWSFPVSSSVGAKIEMGMSYPLIQNLKYWKNELSKFKKVIFFLYEDTQPLGVFFSHVAKISNQKAVTVCIQHGIFYKTKTNIRIDGKLSNINFVWSKEQADIIDCDKLKTFEIGMPYTAIAQLQAPLIVVIVGIGVPYIGNDLYRNSLLAYSDIYKALTNHAGLKVYYRPHPNEWAHPNLVTELRELFPLLDEIDKVSRLNGPRAIFIGAISSFLYESRVAGHLVAHLRIYDELISNVNSDFSFAPEEIDKLIKWTRSVKNDQYEQVTQQNIEQSSPLERFVCALHSANLVG